MLPDGLSKAVRIEAPSGFRPCVAGNAAVRPVLEDCLGWNVGSRAEARPESMGKKCAKAGAGDPAYWYLS